MKQWRSNMKIRAAEVRMLHIGLNAYIWWPQDIWFVLTGRA